MPISAPAHVVQAALVGHVPPHVAPLADADRRQRAEEGRLVPPRRAAAQQPAARRRRRCRRWQRNPVIAGLGCRGLLLAAGRAAGGVPAVELRGAEGLVGRADAVAKALLLEAPDLRGFPRVNAFRKPRRG